MDSRLMVALLAIVAFAGCTADTPDTDPTGTEPTGTADGSVDMDLRKTVTLCTNFGAIEIQLYNDIMPITANNFYNLAASGYYDGVIFHRIITDFMMQGGDPKGTGTGGEAFGGGTIPDERHDSLKHDRAGLLSMAKTAAPNTGGSQFFITFGATPWLDGKHAIFGEVVDGMDVVNDVENRASAPNPGTPRTRVVMEDVLADQGAEGCGEIIPEPAKQLPEPAGPPCDSYDVSAMTLEDAAHTVVGIESALGCIVVELYDDKSPVTVQNFLTYVNEDFYQDLLFHRIVADFMMQTGGMQANGTMKESTHDPIVNEARSSGLKNTPYTLAMARTGDPDSATNQFFINTATNTFLDPGPDESSPQQAGYAVFGMVIAGKAVVDAIEATPTTMYDPARNCQNDGSQSCPEYDVPLVDIMVLES